jgi:uncharacterized membrane protein YhfC
MLKNVHTLLKEGSCWSWYGKLIEDIRAMLNGLHTWFAVDILEGKQMN